MNRGIFRLVFSAVRGMWVAVDEHAVAHAGGEPARVRTARRARAHRDPRMSLWFAARAVTFAVLCALGMQPLAVEAQATLPITPDRSGPTHPVVGVSASGVPLVNITAPNGAGVSMNKFTQYGVGTQGAVIVNSGQNTQSQLAGWVQGNPFLGNSAARVIVNQVTSGNPTQLLGPTEIAGNRANLVVANPAGISCAGCGFINAPRVSLTTGLPTFNADGSLAGFNVTQGHIGIAGAGLDAHGSAIDLIARAMMINGQVWADSINAVAGANQVDYASRNAQAQAGAGAKPGVAIDTQALGSMYAQSIRLIGTETGVGVRDAGQITSLTGDIQVSSNGDVTIAPAARILAAGNAQLSGATIANQGAIVSGQTTRLAAAQSLANTGTVAAGGDAVLSAQAIANAGLITASGAAQIDAASVINDAGSIVANHALNIQSAGAVSNVAGQIGGNADVTLSGITVDNTRGAMHASGALTVTGETIRNAQTAQATLPVTAGVAPMTAGMEGATLALNATQAIDNTAGAIRADQNASLASTMIDNTSGTIQSPGKVTLAASDTLINRQGDVNAGQQLAVSAGSLANDGKLQSSGDVTIIAQRALGNTGQMVAGHDLAVTAQGTLDNAGTLSAGNAASVAGGTVYNRAGGEIVGGQATNVHANQDVTNDGLIDGGATVVTAGGSVANTGRIYGDSVAIGANTVTNDQNAQGIGGVIASRGDLDIGAQTVTNQNNSLLYAANDMRIGGALDVNRQATGSAGTVTNNGAQIDAGRNVTITANRVDNLNSNFRTTQVTTDSGRRVWYQLPGSTGKIDPSTVYLYHVKNHGWAAGGDYPWLGDDDYKVMVLPSSRYTFATYAPFTQNGVVGTIKAPYQPSWVNGGDRGDGTVYPPVYDRMPDSPIWAVFGIAPPAPMPSYRPEDGGAPLTGNEAVKACFGMMTKACAPVNRWITGSRAAYDALGGTIIAYNRDVRSREVFAWTIYDVRVQTTTDTVAATQPGKITAGGNIVVNAQAGRNDKSQIVGGGNVSLVGMQDNRKAFGQQTFAASGQAIYTHVVSGGAFSGDERQNDVAPYQPALPPKTIELPVATPNLGNVDPVKRAAAVAAAVPGDMMIRTVTPNLSLPNNALYRVATDQGSHFLVQTDPRFADYRTWLSSDAMLDALKADPDTVLKRIGDGFYEQQLIQQQVTQATGQRFIGDYTDNQGEYQALMANGVAAARQFGLNIGTALTDAQMTALTSDIVWLVNQTVTLPDGSRQTVLVPQVYLHANAADVTGNGTIIAGKNVSVDTNGTFSNSGTIASRGVTMVTADTINHAGTLAGGTVLASAAQDLNSLGGLIQGNTVGLSAGRDVNVTSTSSSAKAASGSATAVDALATVNAGTLQVQAGRDLNANAAALASTGDTALLAGNDVNLNAVRQGSQDAVRWSDKNRAEHSASTDTGTQIATGGNLAITAGRDVNTTAAHANARGALGVTAGRDVNLDAGQQSASALDEHYLKESGFLSSKSTHTIDASSYTDVAGTTLSGNTVTVATGHDLTAKAATIAGTGDVNLTAGRDLTVTTADTATSEHHFKEEKKSGFGANVTLDAATGATHHDETHEVKQSGFTLGVSGGAIGAALNAGQKIGSASQSHDGRASALWGMAAARDAYDAGAALAGPGGATGGAAVSLSWGTSQSKQTLIQDSTRHQGTNVSAGGTAAFVATGKNANGHPGAGDLTIVGSNVTANTVTLGASHDIKIVSATDTDDSHSTNQSSGASVGISYGIGQGSTGFGVSASTSMTRGNADSQGTSQANSHISGRESITFVSGNDTQILGATLSGGRVSGDVDGNVAIASRQDTEQMHAQQQSMGGGLSISQGGGSASFSTSKGNANGNYANVAEQSGIDAGESGFDIAVKGNTDLTGAVIASAAGADKNRLATGTLSWHDIQNHADYNATSVGISAGGAFGSPNGQSNSGPTSGKNPGGISPMIPQHDRGSQDGMAQSAVAAGTITIADAAYQQQNLADLKRDTGSTNSTVGRTPDLNNVLDQQSDMMAAAQAAGEAVAKTAGDIADKKRKDALAKADAAHKAGDAQLEAQYLADAKDWSEGGDYRAALYMAGGALLAGLGGGNAVAGAAGAGLSSLAAPKLQELASGVAGGVDTGNAGLNEALGNLAANIAAGGLGAVVGGGSGAATAANVDRFNRQLHPDEKQVIANKAKGDKAEENRLTRAACYEVKCWAEYPVGSTEYNENYVSQLEATQLQPELNWVSQRKEAGLFAYTPLQKVGDAVQSDPLGVAKDTAKVVLGGVTAKTGATICATSGVGCGLGGAGMIVFSVSDMAEGTDGLYNRYNGINAPGVNPLRYDFNQLSQTWGDIAYDGLNLLAAVAALKAPVPFKTGVADGMNRPNSIFGVTVPRIDNPTLNPLTKLPLPHGTTQGILLFGVGGKGVTFINDIRNNGDKK